jgi:glyoxylase-like metal-dependent hydrolase (beta-lactamase superfamily II)
MAMAEPTARRWVKSVVASNPGPLTLDGTRTYIGGGDPCLVIDPGPDLADHLDAVEVALGVADVAAAGDGSHAHPTQALLDALDAIPWAPTCPHGRPVAVPMSLTEIERRFGR